VSALPVRTYRFGPLDRSGLVLGLSGRQCAAVGAGAFLAGWLLDRHAPPPLVLAPFLAAVTLAFIRVGGEPICDVLPAGSRFATRAISRSNRWLAPIPHHRPRPIGASPAVDLPPFMAGLTLIDAGPAPWTCPTRLAGVGVVVDRRTRSVSGTLRAHAGGFCLVDRADQERLVAGWGDALAGFCREGGPVSSVRWTEWMAPTGVEDCNRFLDEHGTGTGEAATEYRQLLATAASASTAHDVLITVTVDQRRLDRRRAGASDAQSGAVDALLEQLRLLAARLEVSGLRVDPPLSPAELADVIRRRFDPHGAVAVSRPASLAAAAGVTTAHRAAPLASDASWSHVRVDGSAHRSFWVAEWPRLDVPPNWIEPLLLHPGAVRTVSVVYEPVPPGQSRRQIDREATKLVSDEEQRVRSGFRIGARHRRQHEALGEREAELVAGYAELCFAGFLTVSAPNIGQLDEACAAYVQAAAQAGLDLRRLDGRHDLGLLCALPIGRGLATRRTW
jgi:hypothetical protein